MLKELQDVINTLRAIVQNTTPCGQLRTQWDVHEHLIQQAKMAISAYDLLENNS